ncbi:PspC domain-containing protein [Anaerofustis stercorihominis]|uniref:PspC domain-containing protein n=1 Tax=Anaerofustis stercorihominis TaxID=214853 RepID=UPI001106DA33|nr:PspC domain-containing protein [Anaerofustis stercorihominis]
MKKKLYKTRYGAKFCGVLKGFSEYLNIDVTILRVIYVMLTLLTMTIPFVILYFVLSWIMPEKDTLGYDDYEIR